MAGLFWGALHGQCPLERRAFDLEGMSDASWHRAAQARLSEWSASTVKRVNTCVERTCGTVLFAQGIDQQTRWSVAATVALRREIKQLNLLQAPYHDERSVALFDPTTYSNGLFSEPLE